MAAIESQNSSSDVSGAIIAYISIFGTVFLMSFVVLFVKLNSWGQKTRNTQQRRVFVGSRQRQLSVQGEPTIFVSPSNLPPPPKYEAMAPPSYDEVMRVYPVYPVGQQPITQPLVHALAQSTPTTSNSETSPSNVTINVTNNVGRHPSETATVTVTPAAITVTAEERRTSVTARA